MKARRQWNIIESAKRKRKKKLSTENSKNTIYIFDMKKITLFRQPKN